MRHRLCLLTFTFGLLLILGCMSQSEWTPEDEDHIRETVANISDARRSAKRLAELFTEAALPNKQWLKKTEKRSFVVEDVEVTGDTAELDIVIEDHFGEVLGSQTWACEKIDDKWKISAAPLP